MIIIDGIKKKKYKYSYQTYDENFILEDDRFGVIQSDERGVLLRNNGRIVRYLRPCEIHRLQKHIEKTLEHYKENDITDKDIVDFNEKEYEQINKESCYALTNEKKKSNNLTNIYLFQNTSTKSLKIGVSKNPKHRLKQLNTASDVKIVMLYFFKDDFSVEKELHEKYKNIRMNTEWFKYSDDIVEEFKNRLK